MAKDKEKRRTELKILDSQWDQAFLIANLPTFVKARLSGYGNPAVRSGEGVGVGQVPPPESATSSTPSGSGPGATS